MADFSRWLRHAAMGAACGLLAVAACAAPATPDLAALGASADTRRMVDWVRASGDARGRPYAVVDKRGAQLWVFDAQGRLAGHSRALLGSTPGDHTVPGVGAHAQTGWVGTDERTTPAGRFEAEAGRNIAGEHVVWVDYDAAFAIHRLRPGRSEAARARRLATASASDKRVSWGCVVVPVAFYRGVVEKVLGAGPSVVYVLPEGRSIQAFLEGLLQS